MLFRPNNRFVNIYGWSKTTEVLKFAVSCSTREWSKESNLFNNNDIKWDRFASATWRFFAVKLCPTHAHTHTHTHVACKVLVSETTRMRFQLVLVMWYFHNDLFKTHANDTIEWNLILMFLCGTLCVFFNVLSFTRFFAESWLFYLLVLWFRISAPLFLQCLFQLLLFFFLLNPCDARFQVL